MCPSIFVSSFGEIEQQFVFELQSSLLDQEAYGLYPSSTILSFIISDALSEQLLLSG